MLLDEEQQLARMPEIEGDTRMATTRTITVHDHEVSVRTIAVPDEKPERFTAITGGRRTAAWTAAAGVLVVVVGLMPVATRLFS